MKHKRIFDDLGEVINCEMRKSMSKLQQEGIAETDSAKLVAAMAISASIGYLISAFGSDAKPTEQECESLIAQIFGIVKQWVEK
jgi:hypothetical protein